MEQYTEYLNKNTVTNLTKNNRIQNMHTNTMLKNTNQNTIVNNRLTIRTSILKNKRKKRKILNIQTKQRRKKHNTSKQTK